VAFPAFGPAGSHVWSIDVEPAVSYWTIDRCHGCGTHFANPLPCAEEINRYYADQQKPDAWEEEFYVESTASKSAHWANFADKLTRLAGSPGRLLEVGPAAGHLLAAARDQGWSVIGIEATPKFAKIMDTRGVPVHQGFLETFEAEGQLYDMIVMVDVAEHLLDPVRDLERCRRLLTPDGRLVIATCDIGSFAAWYYGLRWRQLVVSHTFYWTKRSLRIALARGGFDLEHYASFRWWDPNPARERREWILELGKLMIRKALQNTWLPITRCYEPAHNFQMRARAGRLDHWIRHVVGDQAVMSDVALVVARPRSTDAAARSASAGPS
jgi:2-polyprenyl-3-methyl-5-hydroxy-6-metoxy-1,4-benzoquinol methylase